MSSFLRGETHAALERSRTSGGRAFDIVFLDRDGTVNALLPGYRTPADFALLDGAAQAVARLNTAGIPVVLVTNQQGLGTGRLSWSDLEGVHRMLVDALGEVGGHLDDIRLCPHPAGTCSCRKPQPGMLLDVLEENPWADPKRCLMVGDSIADEEAAAAAGILFRRVDTSRPLCDIVEDICGTTSPPDPVIS